MAQVSHIIFDSAAFIKRATFEKAGTHVYVPPLVLTELRDRKTRVYMKCLPFQLYIEPPSKESLAHVTDIAKQTGDFTVLSTTDLHVIALTYELHLRHLGEPQRIEVVPIPSNLGHVSKHVKETELPPTVSTTTDVDPDKVTEDEASEGADDASGEVVVDELPDDSEWISEENFPEKALNNFGLGGIFSDEQPFEEKQDCDGRSVPVVACFTTDFAMQNVLLHAGLPIISLSGYRITRPRTHLLWCAACFRPTKRKDTHFCPSCAQPSLHRIPVTLNEDGRLDFHFSARYTKSLRGTKGPIRAPRGGKHADDPIYCPDQRLPDRRPAKAKHPNVVPVATNGLLGLDEEEEVDAAVFLPDSLDAVLSSAFPMHDITSRAARIGPRSDHQVDKRSWHRPKAEHGLRPTRNTANVSKPRTGNKKRRTPVT